MNAADPVGYLASALVLMTFSMRCMVLLRAVAIASNLAFIAYGALAGIEPVLLLHALLLPTNVYRLAQAIRDERREQHRLVRRPRRVQPENTVQDDVPRVHEYRVQDGVPIHLECQEPRLERQQSVTEALS
jgi:hypothetical protein